MEVILFCLTIMIPVAVGELFSPGSKAREIATVVTAIPMTIALIVVLVNQLPLYLR